MSDSVPYVLVPTTPDDADVTAPVTEDPTSAWAAGTFAIGDEVHRPSTHRVYRRLTAGTDGATDYPEDNPTNWQDRRPTQRWAPFSFLTSAKHTATSDITYTLRPGFMNAVAVYGLEGASVSITYKDAPGGSLLMPVQTFAIGERPVGFYEWAFGSWVDTTKRVVYDMPLHPDPELTITVTASGSATRAIGKICCGDLTPLLTDPETGATLEGARIKLVDYSYVEREDDGTLVVEKGRSARDLQMEVVVPEGDFALAFNTLERVLATPACVFGSLALDALNVMGLLTAELEIRGGGGHGVIPITVQGIAS